MKILLNIALYFLSLLLVLLILLQPHKSEGGLSTFSASGTIFGISSDGDIKVKATAVIAALLGLTLLALNFYG